MSPGHRWLRHLALAAVDVIALSIAWLAGDAVTAADRISIVSAYLCLALLCAALLIGPVRAIRTGQPCLNHLVRRDIGIWAAIIGFVHFALALALSMNFEYMDAFVNAEGLSLTRDLRYRLYSLGNISGFLVGVFFLLLLLLSNNRSLSLLGTRWWKRLQRLSYLALAATIFHAVSFQVLESRAWVLIVLICAAGAWVLVRQLRGFRAVRSAALKNTD